MSESPFNKVAGLQTCKFTKKRLQHKCSTVNIAQLLRTPFFTEYLRWFLLLAHNSVRYNIATAKSLHEFNTSEMQMRLFQRQTVKLQNESEITMNAFFIDMFNDEASYLAQFE